MLPSNAEGAEPMQNGHLEATLLAELGINMQGIQISVESVQRSLSFKCLLLDHDIRRSRGRVISRRSGPAVCEHTAAAEAA